MQGVRKFEFEMSNACIDWCYRSSRHICLNPSLPLMCPSTSFKMQEVGKAREYSGWNHSCLQKLHRTPVPPCSLHINILIINLDRIRTTNEAR
ncbi:hypothetical protein PILCRDRAFT_710046 [Piloderma croceum F 1598]|uniref:Uncharacterized protein n=1 Tax=Piloderma croceum (strain F 1598) TaxID=765440 RepID=A0A0C3ENV5_PILCF|nr:hypothetical protein PILCRDRAFT_710046 [Piloderma croceum F 1598]